MAARTRRTRKSIVAMNEREFDRRLADVKQQAVAIEKLAAWISRTVQTSCPLTGIVLPIGATDDLRRAIANIEATAAYVRGRHDAADERGLIV